MQTGMDLKSYPAAQLLNAIECGTYLLLRMQAPVSPKTNSVILTERRYQGTFFCLSPEWKTSENLREKISCMMIAIYLQVSSAF